ncbi:MAG: class I SAM-dependent methyltransferase [Deltaproteobacteria bacterium]|nr:class I SAM-dependent methyltransferase [Deltaproteobacteria bacterium]
MADALARAEAIALPERKAPRSLIAAVNALFRAAETERPDAILRDPYARRFAERDGKVALVRYGRFLLPALGRAIDELWTAHCVRHASIDALVIDALAAGYEQVVIIGAGYDMRASRIGAAFPRVRWFEVDLPATMGAKWEQLANGARDWRDVLRVPLDLNVDSLSAELRRAGLRRDQKTLFVCEGLIHYLPLARLNALLAAIAEVAPRRRLALSFIRSEMYASRGGLFVRLVQTLKEIPRLHFSPPALAALLATHGLQRFRSWTAAEQVRGFARAAEGRPLRLSQDVAIAESL